MVKLVVAAKQSGRGLVGRAGELQSLEPVGRLR
jgi:hypothetical protein